MLSIGPNSHLFRSKPPNSYSEMAYPNRRRIIPYILAGLIACSDQSPKLNITGNWTGDLPDGRFMALFLEDSKGTITGDGFIGNRDVTAVHGTLSDIGDFDATLTTAAGAVTLHSLASEKSLIGELNGAGFSKAVFVLTK
jgi:hypothetical protein